MTREVYDALSSVLDTLEEGPRLTKEDKTKEEKIKENSDDVTRIVIDVNIHIS